VLCSLLTNQAINHLSVWVCVWIGGWWTCKQAASTINYIFMKQDICLEDWMLEWGKVPTYIPLHACCLGSDMTPIYPSVYIIYLLPTYFLYTYLPIYLPTYLLTYLPTYPPTYPTYLPTYPLTYQPTYLLTYLLTYPPTYLPCLSTYLLPLSIYLPTYLPTHILTYQPTYPPIYPTYLPTY
jgi:hypothetical protein